MSRFVIGLTGGIASGKSEVSRLFAARGIDVVDADVAARDVVAPGTRGLAEVAGGFGRDILTSDGSLDRAALRRIVFANAGARARLEAIVHPRIRELLHARCAAATSDYAVVAIPLLAEGGGRSAYPWLGRVLVVDATPDLQRERLMRRDGIDAALADSMIAAQATRAQRLAIADDVVMNDRDADDLGACVDALHRLYLRLAPSA